MDLNVTRVFNAVYRRDRPRRKIKVRVIHSQKLKEDSRNSVIDTRGDSRPCICPYKNSHVCLQMVEAGCQAVPIGF